MPRAVTTAAVLLTVGSAATDVVCFTRLGSVFASVMTSNIVFLGLSAAQHSGALAERASLGVAAYSIGVAAASRLARTGHRAAQAASPCGPAISGGAEGSGGAGGAEGSGGAGASGATPWSRWITASLVTEILVLAVFTAGWEITGAKPEGGAQLILLALAALAMGMQSAVVAVMGLGGVSTTYLTGTLTALIDSLASARPRQRRQRPPRRHPVRAGRRGRPQRPAARHGPGRGSGRTAGYARWSGRHRPGLAAPPQPSGARTRHAMSTEEPPRPRSPRCSRPETELLGRRLASSFRYQLNRGITRHTLCAATGGILRSARSEQSSVISGT